MYGKINLVLDSPLTFNLKTSRYYKSTYQVFVNGLEAIMAYIFKFYIVQSY